MGKLTWLVIRFYQIWSFFFFFAFLISPFFLFSLMLSSQLPALTHCFRARLPSEPQGNPRRSIPFAWLQGLLSLSATGLGGTALPLAEKPALTSLLGKWWPLAPRFFANLQLLFPAQLSYGDVSAVSLSEEPRL